MAKGRPSTCTKAIADKVLAGISKGDSLSKVCRDLDLKYDTVYSWIRVYEDTFFKDSPRAYNMGYDAIADDCVDISDDTDNDYIERDDGVLIMNTLSVQRAKIRIDTRLRLLGKWRPKKYGDRQQIDQNISGKLTVEKLTDKELDEQLAELTKK